MALHVVSISDMVYMLCKNEALKKMHFKEVKYVTAYSFSP